MTVMELASLVGQRGLIRSDGLHVEVTVCDIRYNFGHDEALIRPVRGSGSKWVRLDRITIGS